jgi:hypothetical protein
MATPKVEFYGTDYSNITINISEIIALGRI